MYARISVIMLRLYVHGYTRTLGPNSSRYFQVDNVCGRFWLYYNDPRRAEAVPGPQKLKYLEPEGFAVQ